MNKGNVNQFDYILNIFHERHGFTKTFLRSSYWKCITQSVGLII